MKACTWRGRLMLKFVHERECRDLCQDLRVGRPHTSSAMSLGSLKTRIFEQKKQIVGNGVMFSRYGAPFGLTDLRSFALLFATYHSDIGSNSHGHLDNHASPSCIRSSPSPVNFATVDLLQLPYSVNVMNTHETRVSHIVIPFHGRYRRWAKKLQRDRLRWLRKRERPLPAPSKDVRLSSSTRPHGGFHRPRHSIPKHLHVRIVGFRVRIKSLQSQAY